MNTDAQFRKRMKRWVKRLDIELVTALFLTDIYKSVQQLVDSNKAVQTPHDFHIFYTYTYWVTSALAIRRLMDSSQRKGKEVVSLRRFLETLENNAPSLTRRSYVHHFPGKASIIGHANFDHLVGKRETHLPPRLPRRDLRALIATTKKTMIIVNKQIAHLDIHNLQRRSPSVDQVRECFLKTLNIYLKYRQLVTGLSVTTLKPGKDQRWMTIFDRPWRIQNG